MSLAWWGIAVKEGHGTDSFSRPHKIFCRERKGRVMLIDVEPMAWVICPCSQDPHYNAATSQFSLTPVTDLSTTGGRCVLPKRPQTNLLMTLELLRGPRVFTAPLLARVLASQQRPEGGWLVEWSFVTSLTETELWARLVPLAEHS